MSPNPPSLKQNSHPSLAPNITLAPVTPSTLPAYRRLITLLLPIRYPDQFYKDSISKPTPSSLALCALWHDPLPRKLSKRNENLDGCAPSSPISHEAKVIAGIQCRIEPLPTPPADDSSAPIRSALYIQTLAVLAPYRSLGIATALLNAIMATALMHYSDESERVVEVYAHVWEANEEALEWYGKRGFLIEKGVVEGYYRKLRPSGARVVRRRVGVGDWLRVKGEGGMEDSVIDEEGHFTEAPGSMG